MKKRTQSIAVLLSLAAFAGLFLDLIAPGKFIQTAGAQTKSKEERFAKRGTEKKLTDEQEKRRAEQIQAVLDEKKSRTAPQKKIDSQILYAERQQRGLAIAGVTTTLRAQIEVDSDAAAIVDIKGDVSEDLLRAIAAAGGKVLYVSDALQIVRARLPLAAAETLAARADVRSIKQGDKGKLNKKEAANFFAGAQFLNPSAVPLAERFNRRQTGTIVSEGDTTHFAALARQVWGATGRGVKVGVLSDSVRYLAQSQAAGELPAVTVIPGQDGIRADGTDIGEGTAILEIIHDIAPQAQLFYATGLAEGGAAQFADNIRRLRFEYGVDILVDDIGYGGQSSYQDDLLAQAVNDVTASGGLYFSSAGNEGNANDGYSSVWEGDFKTGAAIPNLGALHDFGGGATLNRILANESPVGFLLKWSDAIGASANDYDLLIFDPENNLVAASTDVQDGDDDAIEGLAGEGDFRGFSFAILQSAGAQARAVRLEGYYSIFERQTAGRISGQAAAKDAVAVAATPAGPEVFPFPGSPTGPFPFFFNGQNKVEVFSSDGPRRIFYRPDGTPVKANNFLFATNGGTVRRKPEITAADGVSTSAPGFETFFGTSAAAPHAAAIAALVKSKRRSLTAEQIKTILYQTAIDIEQPGFDRDSGHGIVNAVSAVGLATVRRK